MNRTDGKCVKRRRAGNKDFILTWDTDTFRNAPGGNTIKSLSCTPKSTGTAELSVGVEVAGKAVDGRARGGCSSSELRGSEVLEDCTHSSPERFNRRSGSKCSPGWSLSPYEINRWSWKLKCVRWPRAHNDSERLTWDSAISRSARDEVLGSARASGTTFSFPAIWGANWPELAPSAAQRGALKTLSRKENEPNTLESVRRKGKEKGKQNKQKTTPLPPATVTRATLEARRGKGE
jgi:hypothetical protein